MPFFDQYPYTNFHNVNLDWVLERVKEWGALVEQNNIAFQNLEQANEDFKSYVTSYLENLDVQAQIDDKLDRMFESGELTDYLQPYVSNTVTTWLDENITEPEGVIIDSSLTVAGACADAKATGDRLTALDNRLEANIVPDEVKKAIYFLLNASAYDERVYISEEVSSNLLKVKGWANIEPPVYELEIPFESTGNNQIDTGFAYQIGHIYTVCFDVVVSSANVNVIGAIFSNKPSGAANRYSEMAITRLSSSSTALVYWGYGLRYENSQNDVYIGDRVRAVATVDGINYRWEQTFKNITRNITRHFSREGNAESIATGVNVFIGATAGNRTAGFIGTLNEFMIYDRQFSSTEINSYINEV